MAGYGSRDDEPRIEIRRALSPSSSTQSYQTVETPQANGGPVPHRSLMRSLTDNYPGVTSGRRDGLSTFSGVFCPVALAMFSVLLFLRIGYVVGQSGILFTVLQLMLSYAIIILTTLSLCAISTNGAIEGGGVYYMISRALGPEFGGSVGVLFYIANVFGCALYLSGFTEIFSNNLGAGGLDVIPTGDWWSFLYGFLASLLILLVSLVGAALFAKVSVIILALVALSYSSYLISLMVQTSGFPVKIPYDNVNKYPNGTEGNFTTEYADYTGFYGRTFKENFYPNYTMDYTTEEGTNFAIVFSIVFSGVTGIMAGANMSGDLRRPSHSIPSGTMQAVLFTLAIYLITTFLVGATCTRQLLHNDYIVMQDINLWPPAICIGVICTTLSAGLSNLIGASRVITRLAEDKLFGQVTLPFTVMFNQSNPIVSVLFSWVLVMCVLLIGALNKIAKVTSIFFLLSYAGVNIATLALELASAPNFRPTFRYFSWHTSLLGFIGCVIMMFVIDSFSSGIAIILLLLLLITLHYTSPVASWGSISQALIFHQVRKYLLLLDSRKDHVKYWRPQILLLVKNPKSCLPLIDFVNDLKKSGLYVLGHVHIGNGQEAMDPLHEISPYWLSLVDYAKVKAFVELTLTNTVREGVQQMVRLSGLGAMKPNTVILGFYDSAVGENTLETGRLMKSLKYAKLDQTEVVDFFGNEIPQEKMTKAEYVHIVKDALKLHKNICLARNFHRLDKDLIFKAPVTRYVDVWPIDVVRPGSGNAWGWDNSCLFLLQLACILSMSQGWKNKTALRVFLCTTSMQDMQRRETQLKALLSQLRITARSIVVPWDHVICHLPESAPDSPLDVTALPDKYLTALNEMIKRNSEQTAVVFINMPAPPHERGLEQYVNVLDTMTRDLPPTLLVHGLSSVISTAL